ncbi:MAG: AI-2E family transporter, partial [Ignavibacteria bacterium]|nr:AI-2E family transporter [Ignavibacteria bacterium]
NPFVQRLEKRSVPRWISSLLLLAVVVGFLLLSLGKIIPIALAQITELIHNSSGLSESIRAFVTSNTIFALLRNINVPVDELQEKIQSAISSSAGEYFTSLLAGTKNLFSMVAAMFSHILNIILVPFLTFYLLKDFPRIQEYVQSWIPESKKETSITLVNKINVLLSEYVRGALTVAFILGTLIGISYSIFGIPYAIVIGMMMIPLYFVPFFGYFSITAFSIIAVLLSGEPTLFLFLVVFITMGIIILSDMVVLSPKFIGEKVGIHPVLLVFSLFVFSILFGFIGLVLALPVTAIILLLVEEWRNYLKKAESF